MATDASAPTWRHNSFAHPDDSMCRSPNRRVDALEQASFRRCRWLHDCDRTSYLDTQTARPLVAPSHFLSTKPIDLFVGSNRAGFARRAYLAQSLLELACRRLILCDLISAVVLCRADRNTTAQHAINVPAAGALPRRPHIRRSARIFCAAFRLVRFWPMHLSISCTPVFHVGPLDEWG